MKRIESVSMALFCTAMAAVAATGTAALGDRGGNGGGGGGGGGGGFGDACPTYYWPVLCPNGVVYSNDCFAGLAGQTGCTPIYGDPPVIDG